MSAKWIKFSAAALFAASLAATQSATATTVELTDFSGNSSGWTATWADVYNSQVALTYRGTVNNQFLFEKDVTMGGPTAKGIEIVFQKISPDAKQLVINDEVVRNQTGMAWGGFNFVLAAGTTGGAPNFAFTSSDGSAGIGDFSILPFTSYTLADQNSRLSVSGGTVDAGGVWLPGAGSQTGLAIVANGSSDSFTLKEIPAAIPLPAAAWTGLSTLLGLGLVGVAKNARRLLA